MTLLGFLAWTLLSALANLSIMAWAVKRMVARIDRLESILSRHGEALAFLDGFRKGQTHGTPAG